MWMADCGCDARSRHPPVMRTPHVVLYTRSGCHLCEAVEATICRVRASMHFELEIHDVDDNPKDEQTYGSYVPVVVVI